MAHEKRMRNKYMDARPLKTPKTCKCGCNHSENDHKKKQKYEYMRAVTGSYLYTPTAQRITKFIKRQNKLKKLIHRRKMRQKMLKHRLEIP